MSAKRTRIKRVKLSPDPEEDEAVRKSRIRDSNKEFNRRMTILQSWSNYWSDYNKREGEAYPLQEAKALIKRTKKITCPISSCRKAFTSIGGLRYHYARCNIEPSFKCLVCNPALNVTTRGELLRHMILNHHQDLPPLNADQLNIVNSYLSCQNRTDKNKKERRINTESENLSSPESLVKSYGELVKSIYASEPFLNRPYRNWRTSAKDWDIVTHAIERRRFYPPEIESVTTRLPTGEKVSLQPGTHREFDRGFIFFTGGINTSLAWMPKSPEDQDSIDLIAISVNCCSMDQSYSYKESHHNEGCIQIWTFEAERNPTLSFMICHTYGTIFEMAWCPLGCSWTRSRLGLLALACGDGQIRILSVPHLEELNLENKETVMESVPMFRVKPIANLMPPGVGSSSDYQSMSCKSLAWSLDNGQRYIVAGYVNGAIALYDLSNLSPILYVSVDNHHIYQPLKSWFAHGGPVTSVAFSSSVSERSFVASGSIDRQLKLTDPMDLSACIVADRAPINRILWDFRFRGIVSATDTAFTSFNNRVNYKYPSVDGMHSTTISSHRASVYGLASSIITSSIATADQAGEVFVLPQLMSRHSHKRDRNMLGVHSLYTMVPFSLEGTIVHNGSAHENVESNQAEEDGLEANADFSHVERTIANLPDKFLLPIEHRPVTNYNFFKRHFGLECHQYNHIPTRPDMKVPESCQRAMDTKRIFCDRPCDYPFSSINQLEWSPNINTFQYLLTASQVGLCRLVRVRIVEQVYKSHVESLRLKN